MAHNNGNKATLTSNLDKCENQNESGREDEESEFQTTPLHNIYIYIYCFFQEKRSGSNCWGFVFTSFWVQITLGMHSFQSIFCKFKKHSPKNRPCLNESPPKKKKNGHQIRQHETLVLLPPAIRKAMAKARRWPEKAATPWNLWRIPGGFQSKLLGGWASTTWRAVVNNHDLESRVVRPLPNGPFLHGL